MDTKAENSNIARVFTSRPPESKNIEIPYCGEFYPPPKSLEARMRGPIQDIINYKPADSLQHIQDKVIAH